MKDKLQYAVTYFFIGIVVLACMVGMLSCNPSKRALKHIQKAERLDNNELAKWCAKRYNPIDSINERIVYRPGKTVYQKEPVYIEVDCDSLMRTKDKNSSYSPGKANQFKVKCPPCDSVRVDTVYIDRFERAANTAALDSLNNYWKRVNDAKDKEIKDLQIRNTELQTRLKTWRSIAYILGIAWALFFVWKFVRSKFKIL